MDERSFTVFRDTQCKWICAALVQLFAKHYLYSSLFHRPICREIPGSFEAKINSCSCSGIYFPLIGEFPQSCTKIFHQKNLFDKKFLLIYPGVYRASVFLDRRVILSAPTAFAGCFVSWQANDLPAQGPDRAGFDALPGQAGLLLRVPLYLIR